MSSKSILAVLSASSQTAVGPAGQDRVNPTSTSFSRELAALTVRVGHVDLSAASDARENLDASPLLGDSSDTSDLAWIIPTAIVCIFAMFALAFGCYYGVRRLEVRLFRWCAHYCPCCCTWTDGDGMYDSLSEDQNTEQARGREAVRLKDFRERAPSYGVTQDTKEHYVPRRDFNPFDD